MILKIAQHLVNANINRYSVKISQFLQFIHSELHRRNEIDVIEIRCSVNFPLAFCRVLTSLMMSETDGWLNDESTSPPESFREHTLDLMKTLSLTKKKN